MVIITLKKIIHSTVLFTSMIISIAKFGKKKMVHWFFPLQFTVTCDILYTVCCRANDCMCNTIIIEVKHACPDTEEGFSFLPDK